MKFATDLVLNGNGTLDLNGRNARFSSLASGVAAGGFVTNSGSTLATLSLNSTTATTFSGQILDGTAPVALVKNGAQALTLGTITNNAPNAGLNNYSGGTTLNRAVVQGAGGMRFHAPGYLAALRELADEHDVLLIFDEIATGFGRTGALFAAEHAGVSPDVMCVGKAMTGGYLTMSAALCTTRVAEGISSGAVPLLAHGPTFMGNPLAAAVSNASIDLLLSGDWRANIARIERGLREGLAPARKLPGVADVRVLGAIGVVQLTGEVDMAAATEAAVRHGVWLRPFRDLVYTMPPYISTDADIAAIAEGVVAAAATAG